MNSPVPISAAVWRLAAVVVVGAFMSSLDTSVVNVGLDRMSGGLHATLSSAQWVASGYLLALAAAMPMTAWLTRRVGARRVWLGALAAFTVVSAACAAASGMGELIALRVAQGLAGGMLIPAGQMILARAAGPARMGRVMSTVGVAVVLAPVVGPVVGGLLIAESWRWLFLINVPFGLAGLAAGTALIPRTPGSREAGRLDVVGLVLAGAGLPLLTYGITLASRRASLASTGVLVGLLGGTAALAAFGVWSMKTPRPLLNLRLWGNRAFCAALGTGFFGGAALFGGLVLVPLYFEVQRGQSTVHTGLLLIGQGIGAAVTMPISGRLTDRVGGGVVSIAGFLIMLAAALPMAALGAHASYVAVEALFTALGLGTGLAIMPSVSAAYSAVEPAQIPDATPQLNGLQRVGGSIGTAVLVVLVDRSLASGRSPAAAFHTGFLALSAVIVLALVPSALLTVVLRRRPQHSAPAAAARPASSSSSSATAPR